MRATVAAAAVVAVAVTVGLVGTGGTYALWNASASVSGATISTGTVGLAVEVDGVETSSLGNLAAALGPGDAVAKPVTLVNSGTTPLSIHGTSTAPAGALTSALALALAPVASASSCTTGVATGASSPVDYTMPGQLTLPGGGSKVICLVLTLPTDADPSAAGQSADFQIRFTGDQA